MTWSIQSLLEMLHVDLLLAEDEFVGEDDWKTINNDPHLLSKSINNKRAH